MNELWLAAMLVTGGLFAGGVVSIAWERVPAWQRSPIPEFRDAFAHTLRQVDRLQPALLTVCLISTVGFAVTTTGAARALAIAAAGGFLLILIGSVAWLVPIQQILKPGPDLSIPAAQDLRARWMRGHLIRTLLGVALFALTVVATIV